MAGVEQPLDSDLDVTDFNSIVEKYGDFVYDVAFKMMQKPEDAEDVDADQDVVDVGDDIVGILLLGIRWRCGMRHSTESTDNEECDEPEGEEHGSIQFN